LKQVKKWVISYKLIFWEKKHIVLVTLYLLKKILIYNKTNI